MSDNLALLASSQHDPLAPLAEGSERGRHTYLDKRVTNSQRGRRERKRGGGAFPLIDKPVWILNGTWMHSPRNSGKWSSLKRLNGVIRGWRIYRVAGTMCN